MAFLDLCVSQSISDHGTHWERLVRDHMGRKRGERVNLGG